MARAAPGPMAPPPPLYHSHSPTVKTQVTPIFCPATQPPARALRSQQGPEGPVLVLALKLIPLHIELDGTLPGLPETELSAVLQPTLYPPSTPKPQTPFPYSKQVMNGGYLQEARAHSPPLGGRPQ